MADPMCLCKITPFSIAPLCVDQGYTFIEHYAGCGMMTDTLRSRGCGPAAKLDIEYSPGMDILSPAGFACMAKFSIQHQPQMHSVMVFWSDIKNEHEPETIRVRTHIVSVLRGSEDGFINWHGIKCSTWVSISRPTTLRSFLDPLGNRELPCVEESNVMASRLALILVLVLALSGTFIVEQPGSSLLWRHPRLQWVCGLVKVGCAVCESCGILNQICPLAICHFTWPI